MNTKVAYRVKNWPSYNQSLINRGNLTIWISPEVQGNWYAKKEGGRGRPMTYSDKCIEVALTLRSLFRFPLRATQGFIEGLFELLKLDLQVPHYSRLSRRAGKLAVFYYSQQSSQNPTDLVVDSTGLKIYGEGEWKVRIHGKQARRSWRKLHVAVNAQNMQAVSIALSSENVTDGHVMPLLLKGAKNLGKVYADGAYLSKECFDSVAEAGGQAVIAVRANIKIARKKLTPGLRQRNKILKQMRKFEGRNSWKKKSGYHKRSLAETHMSRFKKILGGSLSNTVFENQFAEAAIKTLILNKMSGLGMPISYKIKILLNA